MRTEVKIGIAVALFIAIVVVAYVMWSSAASGTDTDADQATNGDTPAAPEPEPQGGGTPAPEDDGNEFEELPVRDDLADGRPERRAPVEREPLDGLQEPVDDPLETPGEELAEVDAEAEDDRWAEELMDGAREGDEPEPLDDGMEEPEPLDGDPVEREPDEGYRLGDPIEPAPIEGDPFEDDPLGEEPIAAGGMRTYTVEEGDAGFWTISVKVYGDGKYWKHIRDANPGVDTRTLRDGQKILYPPLAEIRRNRRQARRTAAGEGEYVVTEDDTQGYWGIAKKVYDDASMWTVIRDANPDVDPTTLQPGQVLATPPAGPREAGRGEARAPARGAAEGDRGKVVFEGGRRMYVVAEGDAGFWTVADRAYGHGKYMEAVREANPDVDPRALQPGQRLLVPELTDDQRSAAGRGAPAEPVEIPTEPEGDYPRPVFD